MGHIFPADVAFALVTAFGQELIDILGKEFLNYLVIRSASAVDLDLETLALSLRLQ